jgi:hypothetical protein
LGRTPAGDDPLTVTVEGIATLRAADPWAWLESIEAEDDDASR